MKDYNLTEICFSDRCKWSTRKYIIHTIYCEIHNRRPECYSRLVNVPSLLPVEIFGIRRCRYFVLIHENIDQTKILFKVYLIPCARWESSCNVALNFITNIWGAYSELVVMVFKYRHSQNVISIFWFCFASIVSWRCLLGIDFWNKKMVNFLNVSHGVWTAANIRSNDNDTIWEKYRSVNAVFQGEKSENAKLKPSLVY